jgi:hypothetical protein
LAREPWAEDFTEIFVEHVVSAQQAAVLIRAIGLFLSRESLRWLAIDYPQADVLLEALKVAPADKTLIRIALLNRSPRLADVLLFRCSLDAPTKKRMFLRVARASPCRAKEWLEGVGGPAVFSYTTREYSELLATSDVELREYLLLTCSEVTIVG